MNEIFSMNKIFIVSNCHIISAHQTFGYWKLNVMNYNVPRHQ